MAVPPPQVSDDALAVLRGVSERAMDGYMLQSLTGLDPQKLGTAVRELEQQGLVVVKGQSSTSAVSEAYVYVPPSVRQRVAYLLGFQVQRP